MRLLQHLATILHVIFVMLPFLFARRMWRAVRVYTVKEKEEEMKNPFEYWDKNAHLEYQNEDVRIYDMNNHKFLFVGQIMYASTTERGWYIKNVMPYAQGKCLEIGLGLGVASKCIIVKPEVKHLLTIEKDERVIEAFGRPLRNHNILHMDINDWLDGLVSFEPFYDFIFVDHYAFDEEDLEYLPKLADRLKPLLKPGGNMVFWIDENAEEEDKDLVRELWHISS